MKLFIKIFICIIVLAICSGCSGFQLKTPVGTLGFKTPEQQEEELRLQEEAKKPVVQKIKEDFVSGIEPHLINYPGWTAFLLTSGFCFLIIVILRYAIFRWFMMTRMFFWFLIVLAFAYSMLVTFTIAMQYVYNSQKLYESILYAVVGLVPTVWESLFYELGNDTRKIVTLIFGASSAIAIITGPMTIAFFIKTGIVYKRFAREKKAEKDNSVSSGETVSAVLPGGDASVNNINKMFEMLMQTVMMQTLTHMMQDTKKTQSEPVPEAKQPEPSVSKGALEDKMDKMVDAVNKQSDVMQQHVVAFNQFMQQHAFEKLAKQYDAEQDAKQKNSESE